MDNCYYEKVGDKTTCINDEIPFDIPNNWTWCRLKTITHNILAGGDRPTKCTKLKNGDCIVPIYSNGVESDGLYGYTDKPVIFDKSITVSARGTIGFSCIRTEPFVPIIRLITIIPNRLFDIDYLYLYFNGKQEKGEGTSTPQLTVPMIKNKLIAVPPINEQIKISHLIAKTLQIISILENDKRTLIEMCCRAKSKILDDIFGENSRYKSYYMHYGTLSDFGTLISGRDLKPDEYNDDNNGVPYLTGASNFENDTVIINRWTPCPVVLSLENDVLITCKGTIGKTAINKIKKCHIARQIMAFRCNEKVLPGFLKLYFEYMTTTLQKASSSLIPGITRSIMLSLNVASPPIEKQQEIIENTQKIMLILESIIY